MGPQKHFFKRHFGASKIVLTKARLLKHDLHFHGKTPSVSEEAKLVSKEAPIVSQKTKIGNCRFKSSTVSRKLPIACKKSELPPVLLGIP